MEEVKEEKIKEEREIFTDEIGDLMEYTAVKGRIKKMHIYYAFDMIHIYITITQNRISLEIKRNTEVKSLKYKAKLIKTIADKPYDIMFADYIFNEVKEWGLENFIKKKIEYLRSWVARDLFPF